MEFIRLYAVGVGGKKSLIGGSEATYEAMVGFPNPAFPGS